MADRAVVAAMLFDRCFMLRMREMRPRLIPGVHRVRAMRSVREAIMQPERQPASRGKQTRGDKCQSQEDFQS